jgi:hypothetical protein
MFVDREDVDHLATEESEASLKRVIEHIRPAVRRKA